MMSGGGVVGVWMVFMDVCGDRMCLGGLCDCLSLVGWRIHTVLA